MYEDASIAEPLFAESECHAITGSKKDTVIIQLHNVRSVSECDELLSEFCNPEKRACVCVVDMQTCSAEHVNFVRAFMDTVVENAEVPKLGLMVLH